MPRKFHGLKRPKVRQDWSKETLYNLSRLTTPSAANKTFFQQKWKAKSMTRAFHNPYVREGTWTRMFDRRLPSVVSMDHKYLAKYDGSEMAQGRGAGLEKEVSEFGQDERRPYGEQAREKTPYMHMTFHPLERRLDTAIWRALFASSVKQARQFVVHGWVKVNGKVMEYPGYQLNPGDMFQVEPERVMFATGAKKRKRNSPVSEQNEQDREEREREEAAAAREAAEAAEEDESEAGAATLESDSERAVMNILPEDEPSAKAALKNLVTRAKRILEDSKKKLSARRQQELRSFTKSVKKTMSKHGSAKDGDDATEVSDTIESMQALLSDITSKIPAEDLPPSTTTQPDPAAEAKQSRADASLLSLALARARANPMDVTKPYATPWKPRAYMSAFAFIPRYLEVNQRICSAVYLRHPVARPGLAEVPTPFHAETMGLAFNWYLRRR